MGRLFLSLCVVVIIAICGIALSQLGWLGKSAQHVAFDASGITNRSINEVSDIGEMMIDEINIRDKPISTDPEPPLVAAAREQIGVTVSYDPAYVSLDYPMGDVPVNTGVCTDVIVRAYRQQQQHHKQRVDLQTLIHEDMGKAWNEYPKIWGLKRPDPNIDHRRVPNLRVFFERHGTSLPISQNGEDYRAGDIVTWTINARPHIGIVSNKRLANGTPLIIHNIGSGTRENDILFSYHITGQYRYG